MTRRGYATFSLGVLLVLAIMAAWVATGHGFPGGSIYRRMTGAEGPTGGLTRAMRSMLHGNFAGGVERHPSAPWIFAYLIGQLSWRGFVLVRRPEPHPVWIIDLVASMVLFAAAIYVPYWRR